MYNLKHQRLKDSCQQVSTADSTNMPYGEIFLENSGTQECSPGHKWEGYRNNYVIHTVNRGKGTLTVRGKTYKIGAGQAFVMFPREFYRYEADWNDPWEYCWCGFEGTRSDAYVKQIGFEKGKHYVVNVPKPDDIWQKGIQITKYSTPSCLDEVRRLSLFLDILAELMEGNGENTKRQTDYLGNSYVRFLVNY